MGQRVGGCAYWLASWFLLPTDAGSTVVRTRSEWWNPLLVVVGPAILEPVVTSAPSFSPVRSPVGGWSPGPVYCPQEAEHE